MYTDETEKVEVVCCGLCSEEFKSRTELYKHFQNQHSINQEFRGYSVLTPNANDNTDINCNENGSRVMSQDNQKTLAAPKLIRIDDQANGLKNIKVTVADDTSAPPPPPLQLTMSKNEDNIRKQAVINHEKPSPFEKNIPSKDKLTQCHSVKRILATGTMFGTRQSTVDERRTEPKLTLHYHPTPADLNRSMAQSNPQMHRSYNVHPLPNLIGNFPIAGGQFDKLHPWQPSAYRKIETDSVDKENITKDRVREFPDERIRVRDFASYPSNNVTHSDSIPNTRTNDPFVCPSLVNITHQNEQSQQRVGFQFN